MHHKAVKVNDNTILITGGRSSPFNPNKNLYTLFLDSSQAIWKVPKVQLGSDIIEPRWRHSATAIEYNGNTC